MKRSISIQNTKLTDSKLYLVVEQQIEGLIPEGQILVDSDKYSFIYLMEDQEDYTYIVMPEQIWEFIKNSFEKKLPVWLKGNDKEVELIDFNDELEYLITNIKGNSNYGQEMVTKVESIF